MKLRGTEEENTYISPGSFAPGSSASLYAIAQLCDALYLLFPKVMFSFKLNMLIFFVQTHNEKQIFGNIARIIYRVIFAGGNWTLSDSEEVKAIIGRRGIHVSKPFSICLMIRW